MWRNLKEKNSTNDTDFPCTSFPRCKYRHVFKQVCVQLPTSAVNVTLLAFAAERNLLLCAVLPGCWRWASGGRRGRFTAGSALSSKSAAAACGGRMMGRTDGQTDGQSHARRFHKSCSAYYASSVRVAR